MCVCAAVTVTDEGNCGQRIVDRGADMAKKRQRRKSVRRRIENTPQGHDGADVPEGSPACSIKSYQGLRDNKQL